MELTNKKVLIVDDDTRYQRLLAIFFKNIGFEPFVTAQPVEAIAYAIKNKPLLITVDYILPQMYGDVMIDVLKEIDVTKDILMLVVSSEISKDFISRAKKHGVNGFLSKPFPMNILFDKVKMIFDGVNPEILKQVKLEETSSKIDISPIKNNPKPIASKSESKIEDKSQNSAPASPKDGKDMEFQVFEL